ncbi:hypothetical protein [Microbacterium sp.]|uniref:hypothetical protein n=1 Tax=Microbacterium sp. TaxID=51671 RepID=UPI00333F57E9
MNIDRKLRSTSARLLLAIPAAAIALSLAACGGAARPSADQVAKGVEKMVKDQGGGELPAGVSTCLAEALLKSDLSNDSLATFAKGNSDDKIPTTELKIATDTINGSLEKCAAQSK